MRSGTAGGAALGAADGGDARRAVRLVALASLVGTTIEAYDFIVYGTMAGLVLNKLFFPSQDAAVSTMLAYTTFAMGFLARPVGGLVFAHFGDRIGRKPPLVLTLSLMGVATCLIGLLPTYDAIGIAAPLLLLGLRLVQGFALGGEWGGAVVMTFEHAPPHLRGFYASFPQIGLALGLCLSSGMVAALSAGLSDAAFLDWGWRAAFLVSILLLAVGLFVRLKAVETPEFTRIKEGFRVARVPVGEVLRTYPLNLVMAIGARLIDGITFAIYGVFSLSFLVGVVHLPRSSALWAVTAAALVLTVTVPLAARWSDRVDRRRLYGWFSLICGALSFPTFWALQHATGPGLAWAAIIIALGVAYAPLYATQPALFCELFDTRVRYTGVTLAYQLSSILSISFTPLIATALLAAGANEPWLVASFMLAAGVVSALSTWAMRRTF